MVAVVIIVISVGVPVIVVSLGVGVIFYYRRWLRDGKEFPTIESITFRKPSTKGPSTAVELGTPGTAQRKSRDECEIKEEELEVFQEMLGEGFFGEVRKGVYFRPRASGGVVVAVKQLRAGWGYRKEMMKEIEMLQNIGDHPYVIKFFGALLKGDDARIVLEFCENGSLWSYLRSCEPPYSDSYTSPSTAEYLPDFLIDYSVSGAPRVSSYDLYTWSRQIAVAMDYLGKRHIIHRDLAARNVLLDGNLQAKVSDFGLSRALQPRSSKLGWYYDYVGNRDRPMPYAWIAIEALKTATYTVQSDVWAFGVTLWEIFNFCQSRPYGGRSKKIVMHLLNKGHRLEKPKYASNEIFDIMTLCWNKDPKERPSFATLASQIEEKEAEYYMMCTNEADA